MKTLLFAAMLMLVGCGSIPRSWEGVDPTFAEQQTTRRLYLMPVDHISSVFEINCMFDDSTLTHLTFFSFSHSNSFWYNDSTGKTHFFVYFEDVRGRQFYIPMEWLKAWNTQEYNPLDMTLYEVKRKELKQYYERIDK